VGVEDGLDAVGADVEDGPGVEVEAACEVVDGEEAGVDAVQW